MIYKMKVPITKVMKTIYDFFLFFHKNIFLDFSQIFTNKFICFGSFEEKLKAFDIVCLKDFLDSPFFLLIFETSK